MRLNSRAMEKTFKTDGDLYNFWKYDETGTIEYDQDTQLPTNTGTLVEAQADTLDFTINEIKNAAGLIDSDSKKFIVLNSTELKKGDEILNSSLIEEYRVVDVFIFANRRQLFATKTKDNPNTHP